jgi:hypothetical protein
MRISCVLYHLAQRARPHAAGSGLSGAAALAHAAHTPLPHQARRSERPAAAGGGAPRSRPSAPFGCRRWHRTGSSSATQRPSTSPWSSLPGSAMLHLPRAARLRKNGREWAGRGRHPGASLHRGAPEATAAIGNSDAARRLSVLPPCADAPKYANLTARYTEKMTDEISRTR